MDQETLNRLSKILPQKFIDLISNPLILPATEDNGLNDETELSSEFTLIISDNNLSLLEYYHLCLSMMLSDDSLTIRKILQNKIDNNIISLVEQHATKRFTGTDYIH